MIIREQYAIVILSLILLSGCINQGPVAQPTPTEQEIVSKYNMPSDVGNLLMSIDADNDFNNPKEQKLADIFNDYGKEQFFSWLVKDIEKDTNQLENILPVVAKYVEFQNSGIYPGTVYYISPKIKQEGKDAVYGLLKGLDSQSQIEAAKAYGVNLKLEELQNIMKTPEYADDIFKDGFSPEEKTFIDNLYTNFSKPSLTEAFLAGSLLNGITSEDVQNIELFNKECQRMDPGIRKMFDRIVRPSIGALDSIGFTDEYLKDPDDPKVYMISAGKKLFVNIKNPGDFIQNGLRITNQYRYFGDFYGLNKTENAYEKTYIIFDDPYIINSNGMTSGGMDHIISKVDGEYFGVGNETNERAQCLGISCAYYNFWDNWIGIGYDDPIRIATVRKTIDKNNEKEWESYIYIYESNKILNTAIISIIKPNLKTKHGQSYVTLYQNMYPEISTGWGSYYDENGDYILGKSKNPEIYEKYKDMYDRGDAFIKRASPWLKMLKNRK